MKPTREEMIWRLLDAEAPLDSDYEDDQAIINVYRDILFHGMNWKGYKNMDDEEIELEYKQRDLHSVWGDNEE